MPLFLKEKKSLVVLTALIFFQLILISTQVPLGYGENYFEKAVFSVFSPVQHGILSLFRSIGEFWENYFYLQNVQSQNRKMKDEMFFLRQENNLLRNALENLRSAKEIEESLLRLHENILVAQVIGFDASNFYKSAVINKGSLDGLRKDMIVLDKNGSLVGRIINPIALKESRVQLITDNESGVGVFSQSKEVMGILSGDDKGYCFLEYIHVTTEDIYEGEDIITSGKDGLFPSGIKVGKIVSITTSTSLFKQVKVEPYFDIRDLDQVAVIMRDPMEIF
ncbi:MAG: rod shape-determining protein MreC [Candidatus Aminicenantes bacterium]|nr:MAG: rod shape-determining protein MreC [Candidatus Aminicenantes bacterium]